MTDAAKETKPLSEEGEFIRAHEHTVTTFNQMLELVADAFDLGVQPKSAKK